MKKNRIRICGRKTSTLPTPPITPSTNSERSAPSGMRRLDQARRCARRAESTESHQRFGPDEDRREQQSPSRRRRSACPTTLCVSTASIRSLSRALVDRRAGGRSRRASARPNRSGPSPRRPAPACRPPRATSRAGRKFRRQPSAAVAIQQLTAPNSRRHPAAVARPDSAAAAPCATR